MVKCVKKGKEELKTRIKCVTYQRLESVIDSMVVKREKKGACEVE